MSLRTSPARQAAAVHGFDNSHGAIGWARKFLLATRRISALVTLSIRSTWRKQFAPIAVACLIDRELRGEAFVVGQSAEQVGFGAGLDHLQFVVADVFFLQATRSRRESRPPFPAACGRGTGTA